MSTNLPFSVGDRVKFGPEFRDFRGDKRDSFEERSGKDIPTGVGIVKEIDDDYSIYVPDVIIKSSDGGQVITESPFVVPYPEVPTKPTTPKRPNMTPQVRRIRNHLLKGNTITQRSALMDFGIMALPRRIADLKEQGFPIETTMEKNNATGQRFAMYRFKRKVDHVSELKAGCTYRVTKGGAPFSRLSMDRTDGFFTVKTEAFPETATVMFGESSQVISRGWIEKGITEIEYVGGLV